MPIHFGGPIEVTVSGTVQTSQSTTPPEIPAGALEVGDSALKTVASNGIENETSDQVPASKQWVVTFFSWGCPPSEDAYILLRELDASDVLVREFKVGYGSNSSEIFVDGLHPVIPATHKVDMLYKNNSGGARRLDAEWAGYEEDAP